MALLTIIQARVASTRLPGKALLELGGRTIIEWVIHRLHQCNQDLGRIVVATGANRRNNPIQDAATFAGVDTFRGPEHDVLTRFQKTADHYHATHILRVTADCPLLDPTLVDQIIQGQQPDITRIAGAPKGLGEEEIITTEALQHMADHASDPADREHVSTFADRRAKFTINYLPAPDWLFDHQQHRLTLDTPDDWKLLRNLHALTHGQLFDLTSREIIEALESNDDLVHLAQPPAS